MSQQTGSNTIRLSQPGAGQTVGVPINADNMRLSLGFEPDPNAVAKNGQNLEFTFGDGGRLVLEGYYDHATNKTLPVMVTENGDELPGEDFLASLREDLLTAAGPAAGAGAPGSGSGEYADDAGSLMDGISRLGALGTDYWGYESEVPEIFVALGETGPGAVAAIPGGPGGPEEKEEDQKPETVNAVAHDNVAVTVADETRISHSGSDGTEETVTIPYPGGISYAGLSGWTRIGTYNNEKLHQTPEDHENWPKHAHGLSSPGGQVENADFWPNDFDVKAYVNDPDNGFRPGTAWEGGNSHSGGVAKTFDLGVGHDPNGTGSISFHFDFLPNNKGGDAEQDACAFFLFRDKGDGTSELVGYKFQQFAQGSGDVPQLIEGDIKWDNLAPGKYTVVMTVLEEGSDAGQKALLLISDFDASYVYTKEVEPGEEPYDEYGYTLSISGNVIWEGLKGGTADQENPHADLGDHRTDGSALAAGAVITSFMIGEDLYEFKGQNGEYMGLVQYDGERAYIEVPGVTDGGGSFRMYEDGEYGFKEEAALHNVEKGAGTLPTIDDLNISYTVYDPEIDSSDTATLYIRTEDRIFEGAADAVNGQLHGSTGNDVIYGGTDDLSIYAGEGNDVIYAGPGGDLIYGGTGSDTMYSGEGNDTFAWADGDLDGNTDYIKGFELNKDALHFDTLFGPNAPTQEHLADLLTQGVIEIQATADGIAITIESGGAQPSTIDIAFAADTSYNVSANQADNAALLAQLLMITQS